MGADRDVATRARRQFGSRRRRPVVTVTPPPGRGAVRSARFAVFFTGFGLLVYVAEQIRTLIVDDFGWGRLVESVVYTGVVVLLTMSALAYLIARLGHLTRAAAHRRTPRAVIDATFDEVVPTMTVLVPSYREDARVIRQTLLSVALQEFGSIRIVLLVDDPPVPDSDAHLKMLLAARRVPMEVDELLSGPRRRFEQVLEQLEHEVGTARTATRAHVRVLAESYDSAAGWFEGQATAYPIVDDSDQFLVDEVLGRLARDFRELAEAIRTAHDRNEAVSVTRLLHLARRLVWTFRAELTSFERKQYASLSHEANKAMNLNSYLGLMGGRYATDTTAAGTVLVPTGPGAADLEVPETDYVLTLDADSVLLPEYCLRLVHLLEQPEHERVAVVQTPYSSYPRARTRIERIAGATTDLQYLVHQGLARHGAAFWVGANAVLRKAALDDIVEVTIEEGFPIKRYVQDRTVIEDTESSLDIRARGWTIHNYPERLSYSATPPDFGALCVQRQRWANGGLLVLGKLVQAYRAQRDVPLRRRLAEAYLRANYLASLCWASFGLLILLVYPFDDELLSRWAVLVGIPYFVAISTDLRRLGYRRVDVVRIYGFNLLLLPVNLAGVLKSIGQAIGGQKIAFARTPKVRSRTVAPFLFVASPVLILVWSILSLTFDLAERHYVHAVFAGINAVLVGYALLAFVGPVAAVVDLTLNIRDFVLPRRTRLTEVPPGDPDWLSVLYHGPRVAGESSTGGVQAAALALAERLPGRDDAQGTPAGGTLEAPAPAPAPRRKRVRV